MKFIKKRLPALLLALVVAVLPLGTAVPVSADLFVGSPYIDFDGHVVTLPPEYDSYSTAFLVYLPQDGYFLLSLDPEHITVDNVLYRDVLQIHGTGVFGTNLKQFGYSDGSWFPISLPTIDFNNFDETGVHCFILKGDVTAYSYLDATSSPTVVSLPFLPVYYGSGDLLNVFSGVGSWLAGAVGDLTTMFWTPDGGLTVLGILAVCSLALAAIMLILYLIAGWLKFR